MLPPGRGDGDDAVSAGRGCGRDAATVISRDLPTTVIAMPARKNISSGSPLEPIFGYSRAVKVGKHVFVSGTTAIQPDGTVAGGDDPYAQAIAALKTIETALAAAGATMQDVVRTRVFATDMSNFDGITRAHAEYFREIRPASTGVEVSRLARPEMLVEIEADAIID